jgi:hypothetical protein
MKRSRVLVAAAACCSGSSTIKQTALIVAAAQNLKMWRPLGAPSRCETAALARVRRRRCATSWQLVWRSLNSRARSPWPPSRARMRPSFNVTGQSERLLSNQNTVINLISTFAKININQSAENQKRMRS